MSEDIIAEKDKQISCPICLKKFNSLMSHLYWIHQISIKTFREKYPGYPLVSDITKSRVSKSCIDSECGKSNLGRKLTEEQKEKISKAMLGEKNHFYGKKHTSETRLQMSLNHSDISGDNNPFRKALQSGGEEFRTKWLTNLKNAQNEIKKDVERYNKICEKASERTTQAILAGKINPYGKGHKNGWYESPKSFRPIYYRSSYELRFLQLCDEESQIKILAAEPFSIPYFNENGNLRNYIPDFLVNDQIIVEVKAAFQLSKEQTKRKHLAAIEYCTHHNMIFIVLTNIDEEFKLVLNILNGEFNV